MIKNMMITTKMTAAITPPIAPPMIAAVFSPGGGSDGLLDDGTFNDDGTDVGDIVGVTESAIDEVEVVPVVLLIIVLLAVATCNEQDAVGLGCNVKLVVVLVTYGTVLVMLLPHINWMIYLSLSIRHSTVVYSITSVELLEFLLSTSCNNSAINVSDIG
jgi:hypothetical protein